MELTNKTHLLVAFAHPQLAPYLDDRAKHVLLGFRASRDMVYYYYKFVDGGITLYISIDGEVQIHSGVSVQEMHEDMVMAEKTGIVVHNSCLCFICNSCK